MDVLHIPFNTFLGIEREKSSGETRLLLRESAHYTNHLNTVHASAQFALGEAASGEYLLSRFQEIVTHETIVPVVRKVDVKYKKPAHGVIRASAHVPDELVNQIRSSLENKGRAFIPVSVTITDGQGNTTMTATYQWFVQILDQSTSPAFTSRGQEMLG